MSQEKCPECDGTKACAVCGGAAAGCLTCDYTGECPECDGLGYYEPFDDGTEVPS